MTTESAMSVGLESSSELHGVAWTEVQRLRELLSGLGKEECVQRLADVWDDIGIEEDQRQGRREIIIQHLRALLLEMVVEEENLRDKLVASIEENLEKLRILTRELKLPSDLEEDQMKDMTIKVKEKSARERVDKLNQLKHDRMKRFKRLTEMEVALCKGLDEKSQLTPYWQAQRLPSEEELQEYRDRIDHLSTIKDQRQVEFLNVRTKAQRIWEELEWTPREEIGKALAEGDVGKFVFSVENMERVQQFYQELEDFAISQNKTAIRLRAKVVSLWERLEEPAEEREMFLEQHQGYNLPTIQALEEEVERLNVLKQQHMSRFIEATRTELNKIWDKCYYGPAQREEFVLGFTDEYTEDVLSAHESELDRMRGFYSDNADLFKLVEKRQSLWRQKLEFDARANDPSRLQNRGGKLLAEQKAQAKLMKQLPKVEEQLKTAVISWEESYGRPFLVDDARYLDIIESQWAVYKQSKETEKSQKRKVKEETTLQEMKFGSKPATPAKKRPASPLASSATKLRKVGPSPLVQYTAAPKGKRLAGKATPRKGMANQRPRKILTDRNCSASSSGSSGSKDDSLKSTDTSLASTGDYHDFKRGLVQGLQSSKTARSSTIPTKCFGNKQ